MMSKANLGIVLGILLSTVCQANTVTIRADEWSPINGVPGAKDPGYMIELVTIILAKHGHEVEYRTMPWKRSIQMVREGEFDCVVGAYKSDAPDFIFPEEPWGLIGSSFYVKKGSSWKYTNLNSLAEVRIGTIGGYAYSDELDAYIEANKANSKVNVLNANNALEQNIKKLSLGRIDVTIESDLVMNAKLKALGMENEIVVAGLLAPPENMFIACSPAKSTSSEYVKLFSDGLKELRASGKLKEILKKYGLKDWK